ncbi:RB1-inducible coiled-coil protein 1 [Drosophila miranda]|uniref:RB1-inducible coiled-coil protein 1 n=1 Tax=Drosophila miranda TaxID=7229 RepID=UPI0007E88F03|nr:RB1-inducible coiled-coil protein 1 [Drosophila miranda]XP_017142925.1 RB1-inducible coiled-coil protein 1 [Drosophila miranda]XP_017142926.1 RB1-inducible coiled-coil protein 1 [Drosophila miranda]XP_017142928.1 RB1-inducible coiled-coil protein 1 [Drosophila miranda]
MMLYVFHVDVGRMLSFDMNVALQSVENLKETIQKLHGIPAVNIVLLVSGGEMLTHSTQVSCYSAGTDTNPIYMFLTGDERLAPTIQNSDADAELRRQVEESHRLPPALETVRQRAQLAQHMRELARKEEALCERLVHEQHLQQQGWSAVVANMEDLTIEFRERFHNFCLAFDRHLQKRDSYLELLRNFSDDLKQLARIPILPGLMALAEADFHGFDELLDNDDVFAQQQQQEQQQQGLNESSQADSPNKKLKMGDEKEGAGDEGSGQGVPADDTQAATRVSQTSTTSSSMARRHNLNLLQWISSKGNHSALQLMSDECIQGLHIFSADIYEKLKEEVQQIIKLANQGDVKEIKGLSDRLCKLEDFKFRIKKMVQEQKEQALALQQNEARAQNLRDNSVLPDLCLSHCTQLQVMLENHIKIREYCRCIANSKDELGKNLHTRLRRIVWIENGMSEFDNRLLFNHRCLRRAERHISIIEQIHRAPCTYVAAVAEVVRRKIFSDEFRQWATRLSIDFDRIHSEELRRRGEFNASFDGHFLNILFPGMGDMPPAFANEHPLSFDTRLPPLNRSDIELLSVQLPELAAQLQLPNMRPVIDFFVNRSGLGREREQEESEQEPPLLAPRLVELQGAAAASASATSDCETDTETEFEKLTTAVRSVSTTTSGIVGEQIARSTATEELLMLSAGTLTEENGASVERMRGAIEDMSKLALACLAEARANLGTFRSDATGYQDELQSELQLLQDKWNVLRMQCEERERQGQEQLEEMRLKLELAERDKLAAVAQAREQLIHEHKTELESLRCRFKLMTSMERSPSDSSLEKLERPTSSASVASASATVDVDQLLYQQRQEMLAQRERAISEAVESERSLWQSRLLPLNSESVMANVGILKDMLAEKERQLEQLREQNQFLTQESYQLKTRLEMITNEDGNSWLKEKIDYLNRDKCRLEEELNQEKTKRLEMETSVAAMKSSSHDLPSMGGTLTRSKSASGSCHRSIALEGCARGDLVFVVWSMRHAQFMVVQDSLTLYFVHGDSLAGLQLTPPSTLAPVSGAADASVAVPVAMAVADLNQIPMPYYAIGRVVDKEYCQARKDDNRYRVSRGSKFYRIKLAPMPPRYTSRRERLESSSAAPATGSAPVAVASLTRDAVDAPGTSGSSVYLGLKQRTVSITSVNEEDDESASLLSERCRYISVSEEDELLAAGGTAMVATVPTVAATALAVAAEAGAGAATQAQSVITEQPTASSKLKLDLLLASADIITQPLTQLPERQDEATAAPVAPVAGQNPNEAATGESEVTADAKEPQPITIYVPAAPGKPAGVRAEEPVISTTAPIIPMSIGTAAISEDSDTEYRSLEGREDTEADADADFPISE